MLLFNYNKDNSDSYSLQFAKEFYKIVDTKDAISFGNICSLDVKFKFAENMMTNRKSVIKGLTIFYNSIAEINHEIINTWHITLDDNIDIFFVESCPNYKPDTDFNIIIKPSGMTVIKYNKKNKLIIECLIYIDNTLLNEFIKNKKLIIKSKI